MSENRMQLFFAVILLVAASIGVIYFTGEINAGSPGLSSPVHSSRESPQGPNGEILYAWLRIPLTDVVTGEKFTIEGFSGKYVILLAFTVPCPVCTAQQREILALNRSRNGDLVFIAVDIDPNEKPGIVVDHIRRNGFSGRYAIAPISVTRSLVQNFGIEAATPAAAPTIVICAGGEIRMSGGGLKSMAQLERIISGCTNGTAE